MSITVPIGVFRWYFENSGFWGVFLGVKGGGGAFRGFLGVFGVFRGFLGESFYLWRNFRVKYRNIPIIAFRGRSIIISAL